MEQSIRIFFSSKIFLIISAFIPSCSSVTMRNNNCEGFVACQILGTLQRCKSRVPPPHARHARYFHQKDGLSRPRPAHNQHSRNCYQWARSRSWSLDSITFSRHLQPCKLLWARWKLLRSLDSWLSGYEINPMSCRVWSAGPSRAQPHHTSHCSSPIMTHFNTENKEKIFFQMLLPEQRLTTPSMHWFPSIQ